MRILVAGASGLIGSAVARLAKQAGHAVTGFARRPSAAPRGLDKVVEGDARSGEGFAEALDGVEVAYWLVHFFDSGLESPREADVAAAERFAAEARRQGVRRVLMLGICAPASSISPHIRNRWAVEERIRTATPDSVALRAPLVIGPDSSALLYLRMVERAPVIPLGRWSRCLTGTIDVRDAAAYLLDAAGARGIGGGSFDLPCAEVLTHADLVRRVVRARHRHRLLVPVPFDDRVISAPIVSAVTGLHRRWTRSLMTVASTDSVPDPARLVPLAKRPLIGLDQSLRDLVHAPVRS